MFGLFKKKKEEPELNEFQKAKKVALDYIESIRGDHPPSTRFDLTYVGNSKFEIRLETPTEDEVEISRKDLEDVKLIVNKIYNEEFDRELTEVYVSAELKINSKKRVLSFEEAARAMGEIIIPMFEKSSEKLIQVVEEDHKMINTQHGLAYKFVLIEKINDLEKRSRYISAEVRKRVYERDGGACVDCGSTIDLEYDHLLPFSKGGSNTYNNIQLRCMPCNRSKSDKIG